MEITNRAGRTLGCAVVLAAVMLWTTACGTQKGNDASARSGQTALVGKVPVELTQTLARDGITVGDASLGEGLLSEAQAIVAFSGVYKPTMFESTPTAYAVKMVSSQEERLPTGRSVWMVHVPGVKQDVTGPMGPPSEASAPTDMASPQTIITDMFAFFDAHTGDHLATVYIGPEQ